MWDWHVGSSTIFKIVCMDEFSLLQRYSWRIPSTWDMQWIFYKNTYTMIHPWHTRMQLSSFTPWPFPSGNCLQMAQSFGPLCGYYTLKFEGKRTQMSENIWHFFWFCQGSSVGEEGGGGESEAVKVWVWHVVSGTIFKIVCMDEYSLLQRRSRWTTSTWDTIGSGI